MKKHIIIRQCFCVLALIFLALVFGAFFIDSFKLLFVYGHIIIFIIALGLITSWLMEATLEYKRYKRAYEDKFKLKEFLFHKEHVLEDKEKEFKEDEKPSRGAESKDF